MLLLTPKTLNDVLEVAPPEDAPRTSISTYGGLDWGAWQFSEQDVAQIRTSDHAPPNAVCSVRHLHPVRMAWLREPGNELELQRHLDLLRDFAREDFRCPPILVSHPGPGWDRQILDGGHRVFAAFDHMRTHPDRTLRVYWNRLHDESR